MAAQPKLNANLFGANELADEAEVERLETQPEPAEQPSPEQQPPPAESPPGQEPQPQEPPHEENVSYGRFKELLDANKRITDELAQHREFRTRLDERQRLLNEANDRAQQVANQQRQAQQRPDDTMDPIGAELWDLKQSRLQDRQTIDQLQNQLQQFGQNYQTGQEQAAFSGWVQNEANTYSQQDPSYFPAARYAADKRVAFWRSIAPNAPQGLAEKMVEGESLLIARLAQQYGGRFAPTIVQLAREWGFSPQPPQNGAVRQAAPHPQAQARQAQLRMVQNGQRMQGLGGVPASGQEGVSAYRNYSPVDIANMTEREFMAAMANPTTARDLRYAMARAEGFDNGEASY